MNTRTMESSSRLIRRLLIFVLAVLAIGATGAKAAPVKALVQDTLYRADGSTALGDVTIRWNGFSTSAGEAVAAGQMTVKTDANGGISIPLIPNTGSSPSGSYYRVVIRLDDGTTSEEMWVVPAVTTTTVAAVRAKVVPQAVAAQSASRDYVDSALAAMVHLAGAETIAGVKTFVPSPEVPAPTDAGGAANKGYVDQAIAGLATVASTGNYNDLVNKPASANFAAPGAIGVTTPGPVNATAYAVNGTPLASSNLSDAATLARNNTANTFAANQLITYAGADGVNPLAINATGSAISNAYGVNLNLPGTGNHRAIGVVNGTDSMGWFSLNGNVNSTGDAGFELGPGGSTARDTFLYRSSAGALTTPGSVAAGAMIPSTSPWADVRAYGAKCDGATDDTVAFQAAINSGYPAWFPAATCVVSNLTMPTASTLKGAGKLESVLLQKAGSTGPTILVNSSAPNVALSDFTINGNASAQTSANIGLSTVYTTGPSSFTAGDAWDFERIFVYNTSGDCYNLQGAGVSYFKTLGGYDCGGRGMYIAAADSIFSDIDMGSTGSEGIFCSAGCATNRFSNLKAWFSGQAKLGTITGVSLTSNVATYTAANSLVVNQLVNVFGLSHTALNGYNMIVTSATSTQFTVAVTAANVASTSDAGIVTSNGAGVLLQGVKNEISTVETQNTAGDGFLIWLGQNNIVSSLRTESAGSNTSVATDTTAVGLRFISASGNHVQALNGNGNCGTGTCTSMQYGVRFDADGVHASSKGNIVHSVVVSPTAGDVNVTDGYAYSYNSITTTDTNVASGTPIQWNPTVYKQSFNLAFAGAMMTVDSGTSLQSSYPGGMRANGADSVKFGYGNAAIIANDGSAASNPGYVSIFYGDSTAGGNFSVQHYNGTSYATALTADPSGNVTLGNASGGNVYNSGLYSQTGLAGESLVVDGSASLQTSYRPGIRSNGADSSLFGYGNARIAFFDAMHTTNPGLVAITYGDGTTSSAGIFTVSHYNGTTYVPAISCDINGNCTFGGSTTTTYTAGGIGAANGYVFYQGSYYGYLKNATTFTGNHTWYMPDQTGTLALAMSATTGSIGGSALTAGQCASGTVSVTNSATTMAVAVSPVTYPGDGMAWRGYVSAAGTVTVKVCAEIAGTPTASTYNVRVIQ